MPRTAAIMFFAAALLVTLAAAPRLHAQGRPAVTVPTFTFDSSPEGTFVFPHAGPFRRIEMRYTMRCPPNGPCGATPDPTHVYLERRAGRIDSTRDTAVRFRVGGLAPDSFGFRRTPTWSYTPHVHITATRTATLAFDSATVGSGITLTSVPMRGSAQKARTEYLWRAEELRADGLKSGNITGIRFFASVVGTPYRSMTIRLARTTYDSLGKSLFTIAPFTTVVDRPIALHYGWNAIPFTLPFAWIDTNNLIVDISMESDSGGTDTRLFGTPMPYPCAVTSVDVGHALALDGRSSIEVPVHALTDIDSAITIAFWHRAPTAPPGTKPVTVEAVDPYGRTILSLFIDAPNQILYWEGGRFVPADFAFKDLDTLVPRYTGEWVHWAFTKNVRTGQMRIYFNGRLVALFRGKRRMLTDMAALRIGGPLAPVGEGIVGLIDEFALWNRELATSTLLYWISLDLNTRHPVHHIDHPYRDALQAYYTFESMTPFVAVDSSGRGNDGRLTGNPRRVPIAAPSIYFGAGTWDIRPNAIFEQGRYTTIYDTTVTVDSVRNDPVAVVLYDSLAFGGRPVDTLIVWPATATNIRYDKRGRAIDSTKAIADSVLHQERVPYERPFLVPDRVELGRVVAPYGTGVDLGDGFTWAIDVSDYAPLLRDTVRLVTDALGNQITVSFDFYAGIPARDPIDVISLWNGTFAYGMPRSIEEDLRPLRVVLPDTVAEARLVLRVSGYGSDSDRCATYCPKQHTVTVDGAPVLSRLVWRDDCALSAIFPQGGDWIPARANWCPGEAVDAYHAELASVMHPGDTTVLDYDVQAYTAQASTDVPRYDVAAQLVTYGPPNFTSDAALDAILAPNDDGLLRRSNPICADPIVVIRNAGSARLTDLDIEYGMVGSTPRVYHWAGNLAYLDTMHVHLGAFSSSGLTGERFRVVLRAPSEAIDQNADDDTLETAYAPPPLYYSPLVIEVRTNGNGGETSYRVRDRTTGRVWLDRHDLASSTMYRDTLRMPSGCYDFTIDDSGDNGLYYYYNRTAGTGHVIFTWAETGEVFREIPAEFGRSIVHQFSLEGQVASAPEVPGAARGASRLTVTPNPGSGDFRAHIHLAARGDADVCIIDLLGRVIARYALANVADYILPVELHDVPSGVYMIVVRSAGEMVTERLVVR